MKRYFMEYRSDRITCGSNNHTYGYANSIQTAKQYISRCRQAEAKYNPRDFRIYDSQAEVDPATDYVPCVFQIDF